MKCLYGDIYKCTSELVAPAETCHSYLACAGVNYLCNYPLYFISIFKFIKFILLVNYN